MVSASRSCVQFSKHYHGQNQIYLDTSDTALKTFFFEQLLDCAGSTLAISEVSDQSNLVLQTNKIMNIVKSPSIAATSITTINDKEGAFATPSLQREISWFSKEV